MIRPPRLPMIADAEASEAQLAVLDRVRRPDGAVFNIFRTLVGHPDLTRRWLVFGNHVLGKSTLPDRVRELVILRVGWLCQAEYEWAQHVVIAGGVGIDADDIERVKAGPEAPEWDEADRAALQATDELHHDRDITDATWQKLCGLFSERQRMDLVFTAGQYNMVSMALKTFGVPLDDGLAGF